MAEFNFRERLTEILDNMDDYEIVELHNRYCEGRNSMDDYIYEMYMIDELLDGLTPKEVLNSVASGFNERDSWIQYNGYGYLESSDDPRDFIFESDIINAIENEENSFGNDDIQDAIDEYIEYLLEDDEEE